MISCQEKNQKEAILISNANIIDVTSGAILNNKDLLIENDRIQKIVDHPSSQEVQFSIDGTGKYIIPGLWDMHAHIVDDGWVLNLYTSLGVTGIRSMHGFPSVMEDIKNNRKDGFYHGFEFLYSSPITDGPGENWPGSSIASSPEEGRELVREYVKKGYDFVKIYHRLDFDTYQAIVEECRNLNITFAGHVPNKLTTEQVIASGQKSIEHWLGLEHALPNTDFMKSQFTDYQSYGHFLHDFLEQYDSSMAKNVLKITKTDQTWFCPTMVTQKISAYTIAQDSVYKSDDRLKYIPQEEQDYWFGEGTEEGTPSYLITPEEYSESEIAFYQLQLSYLKPMLDNGSRFLAGTDTSNPNIYPGFSLHEELQLFVEAGFSELEALQTATLNPAIYANRLKDLGTVEQGKIANLVILDKNPLENIENTLSIYGLVRRGTYLDYTTLERLRNLNEKYWELDELLGKKKAEKSF